MPVKIILQQTRRKNGLSQEKLALASGVSVSYIQKIEQNSISRLSLEILGKLCKTLKCGVSDILLYEDIEE